MARQSSWLTRVTVLALAAVTLSQLAFVAPPSTKTLRGQDAATAAAVAAGGVVYAPLPVYAQAEQTFDGWGPPEITAVLVPFIFVFVNYWEWFSRQPDPMDVTGYGTLGQQVDGLTPDEPTYYRRSPESG
eukprot:TRINITY_DN184_c0_g1_i2.p1 TRINITY_DN184_c0_g1~~TRINITY_DN184_c0_g1_i2.p1  ORF type:complete len:130 (+),score=32.30 TRINITY_DN184_c0_g1_i2:68-457(+)